MLLFSIKKRPGHGTVVELFARVQGCVGTTCIKLVAATVLQAKQALTNGYLNK